MFDVSVCAQYEKMTHDHVHIHAWFCILYTFFLPVLSSLLVVLILSQESSKETTNQPSMDKALEMDPPSLCL